MEREAKRKKQRNEKRSPLQDLNRLPIHKPNTKKLSNLSSSPVAFLISSNSSCSSSSLRPHLDKKSKLFPKIANNGPTKSTSEMPRSKEYDIRKKPFLQKSGRSQPQSLSQRQSWKNNAKPICKNGQRSNLSSVQGNPLNKLKKGSEEIRAKMKNSQETDSGELLLVPDSNNLNCTPVGKVAAECALDSVDFVSHRIVVDDAVDVKANNSSGNAVKTPPLEVSLSPEIQRQSHSKMLVLKSAATPVCYGAGHLVSGVTDKRKCKRIGSLKGFCYKTNLFEDEKVSNDLGDSSIPSLAEASVRWMLSPCDESRSKLELDECGVVCDNGLGVLDLLSSPSMLLCGNASELLCDESSYNGSGSVGNVASTRRNSNVIVSPRKDMDESLFTISPGATYSDNLIGDNSTFSIGSLNSGNVIQTPNSDSSTDVRVGRSRLEVHDNKFVWSKLNPITKTLEEVNLSVSPRRDTSMWDAHGLGFDFGDMASPPSSGNLTQIQENVDTVSSWVSDATLDNVALSQMRISWRDGLPSRIIETDEFDCCCCLSDGDKETYSGGNNDQRVCLEVESGENKEHDLRIDNDLSPILLDYEPCISARGKGKSSSPRPNACAESICTDGGGLVASDDSGWTY